MVMIGTDSHKRTHTFVAVDDLGRRLGECTLRANTDGHLQLLAWAARYEAVTFALEDCRHLTRRLESDLLRAGQRVVRVPTRLMAGARRGARSPGKSDPIDAEAVAIAALRHRDLPVAELDGPAREVKLLSDHRRDLVMQRTRACSQLRWHLHELDPDLPVPTRSLRQANTRARVQDFLDSQVGVVARLARTLLARIGDLSVEITAIEKELKALWGNPARHAARRRGRPLADIE
jgi:transposase